MIKCALLLLSCLTIFAQRTPLSVNGTIVNNPNFTNTASVTWSVTGSNIRGTASAGGDTIWTNSNGTISNIVAGVSFEFNDDDSTIFRGIVNEGVYNRLEVMPYEGDTFNSWCQMNTYVNNPYISFGGDDGATAGEVDIGINAGVPFFDMLATTSYATVLSLRPSAADGTTPYFLGTTVTHTSGNLLELTNKFIIAWDGKTTAAAGFSSTATDSAVTIASTGWTNTFGKNAVVYMDGVGLTFTVYNNALTPVYTNSVSLVGASVLLQPSGKVIITDGTLGVGRATPF